MKRTLVLGVLALAVTAAIDAWAAHYVIEINEMAFGPAPAHLSVGDTLEWKNSDIFRHTATSRTKGFDLDLPPQAHVPVTLTQAGVLDIYCRFHPTMKVTLTVGGK
jgi:plastocyanin